MNEIEMDDLLKITGQMKLEGTDKEKILKYKEYERIYRSHKDRYVSKEIENKAKILWRYMPNMLKDPEERTEDFSYYVEDLKQHLKWVCHHDNKIIFQLFKMTKEERINDALKALETDDTLREHLDGYWA